MIEAIIFKLSPILGGRSEVCETDLMEVLGHMCIIKKTEEAEREAKSFDYYIHYKTLEMFHPVDKKDAETLKKRKMFAESLMPESMKKVGKTPTPPPSKKLMWDHEKEE